MQKFVPSYSGTLRSHLVEVPQCIAECSGIRVFGRRIKSLVFSTDVAVIKNINGDKVFRKNRSDSRGDTGKTESGRQY